MKNLKCVVQVIGVLLVVYIILHSLGYVTISVHSSKSTTVPKEIEKPRDVDENYPEFVHSDEPHEAEREKSLIIMPVVNGQLTQIEIDERLNQVNYIVNSGNSNFLYHSELVSSNEGYVIILPRRY